MKPNISSYDVLILGGGVAACATAITLKNIMPSSKVVIIENRSRAQIATPRDFRIGATLSPHAAHTLNQMGIWESFLAQGHTKSYGTSAAWGSEKIRHNEFIYTPFGYGWHLDRVSFDGLMIAEAEKRGVQFLFETQLGRYREARRHWLLCARSPRGKFQMYAKFIVDATGKKSVFARKQGVQKLILDDLVTIYRFYKSNSEVNKQLEGTYLESNKYGWWFSALLPNKKLAVACVTDRDLATNHGFNYIHSFDLLLKKTRHTKTRTLHTQALGAPRMESTQSQILDRVVGEKWMAVGDATMSYDPLSTLGIYNGLSTNLYAAHAIVDYLHGDLSGLSKYEKLMMHQFKDYEEKRLAYYAEEKRFSRHPFWRRRQKANPELIKKQLLKTTEYLSTIS